MQIYIFPTPDHWNSAEINRNSLCNPISGLHKQHPKLFLLITSARMRLKHQNWHSHHQLNGKLVKHALDLGFSWVIQVFWIWVFIFPDKSNSGVGNLLQTQAAACNPASPAFLSSHSSNYEQKFQQGRAASWNTGDRCAISKTKTRSNGWGNWYAFSKMWNESDLCRLDPACGP